jgi:polysaccharide export outer membrane protein
MLAALCLQACSALPEDGPSARAVEAAAKPSKQPSYALVDVDYRVTQTIDANASAPMSTLKDEASTLPTDLIGVGDVLSVSVYQAGLGPSSPEQGADERDSAAETYSHLVVDAQGVISVPFAGPVRVEGLAPNEAASAVRRALRGKAVDPQVVISSVQSQRNAVVVIGEVKTPGHFPLNPNADRLLDALAAAGGVAVAPGVTRAPRDLTVTIVRGDHSASLTLATLLADPAENIRLAPLDQVRITATPRKIDVFGAVGKGSQIPIEDDTLSLAGALGRIGGLNSGLANAKSVLVFRFERPEVARALHVDFPEIPGLASVPIIYRVNLRDPSGYFIANKFEVAPDDLIYVPTSSAAELGKFLTLVNSGAQFLYDAAVSKSLGL